MQERRQFLKTALGIVAGANVHLAPLFSFLRPVRGEEPKIIIPQGTRRETLAHKNPDNLDTRNLELTPLKDFQTMGTTNYRVDLGQWRLETTGRVKKPLSLNYSQVLEMPSIEKRVLLICPGFFANYGLWKGIQMDELLRRAEAENGITQVIFTSPEGAYERTQNFSLKEVLAGRVFLAYGVNGEQLPEKHGFPLRVVAEGHYGSRWIKYASKMKLG
jgi:DMSO/TMAO reductase YedYZ molybdopterin-dependent catalytic subunit